MAVLAPRLGGASWCAVLLGSRCRSRVAEVMEAPGGAGGAADGPGCGSPPPPGDLRSVLITSVLNLERLEVDLFRCAWTPGQRDRAASSSSGVATVTAAALSPQGPAPLGARHAAPLRRADRGAGAGGGSARREPRRAGALAALLLRADRCEPGNRAAGTACRGSGGEALGKLAAMGEEAPSSRSRESRESVSGTAGRGPCRAGFVWVSRGPAAERPFRVPGDPKVPVLYEVERTRTGKSFSVRSVKAIQHGMPIFTCQASFQLSQGSPVKHQFTMPAVPPPEELLTQDELIQKFLQ